MIKLRHVCSAGHNFTKLSWSWKTVPCPVCLKEAMERIAGRSKSDHKPRSERLRPSYPIHKAPEVTPLPNPPVMPVQIAETPSFTTLQAYPVLTSLSRQVAEEKPDPTPRWDGYQNSATVKPVEPTAPVDTTFSCRASDFNDATSGSSYSSSSSDSSSSDSGSSYSSSD